MPAGGLSNDGHVTVAAARVADGLMDVQIHSDFVTFAASANAKGKIGFDDNTERTFAEVAGVTFCMKADGCICPAGKVLPDNIVLATFPGESALVAVTGGLQGARRSRSTGPASRPSASMPSTRASSARGTAVRSPSRRRCWAREWRLSAAPARR